MMTSALRHSYVINCLFFFFFIFFTIGERFRERQSTRYRPTTSARCCTCRVPRYPPKQQLQLCETRKRKLRIFIEREHRYIHRLLTFYDCAFSSLMLFLRLPPSLPCLFFFLRLFRVSSATLFCVSFCFSSTLLIPASLSLSLSSTSFLVVACLPKRKADGVESRDRRDAIRNRSASNDVMQTRKLPVDQNTYGKKSIDERSI